MTTSNCNSRPAIPSRHYSAKRTWHQVTFFCNAPHAESVGLVGDFNGWDLAATPMKRMANGCWTASLELNLEHHQYLFVVDGKPTLAVGQTRSPATSTASLWIE